MEKQNLRGEELALARTLAALDGGHLNWPIVDEYIATFNETIERTES